jgi:glutamate dehydrogenase
MEKANMQKALWDCYSAYINQLNATPVNLNESLNRYPEISDAFWKAFQDKFQLMAPQSPQCPSFAQIKDLQDKNLFQILWESIQATVRTNFFVPNRQAIALKFLHTADHNLIEIFMDHPTFQGTFMKSAPISRGGIRLSNRKDFRQECLQLVRTQIMKNAIVVPCGGKGVFCLKNRDTDTEALKAYKLYIECILDIADNIENGKIVHPVPHYDGKDFYNVVGADKGTAFFSDEANKISCTRGYWLGDAFASGGEQGYNHKKLAITSRGAWVSVRHHMNEKGISFDKPLTVIGIGDMSGDVFGNGLLGERNLKLLAAFSQHYIFIDPDPDPEESYQERCRLFHMQATWSEYKKLSLGGMILRKKEGPFQLGHQARLLLGIEKNPIEADELIQHILKLPVDLFWLGGVGTFVCATDETALEDDINQNIRVCANQVKSRIISEGANLGFTQEGRIQYALTGGALNTDFVDNSAGVNCSDREVNLKILLDMSVRKGNLSAQDRHQLLRTSSDDVCSRVLKDNHWQNITISFVKGQGAEAIPPVIDCIRMLKNSPKGHYILLPDTQILEQRSLITRPEIAALTANMTLHTVTLLKEMPLGSKGRQEVLDYFPLKIQEDFAETIPYHALYKDLQCAILGNILVRLCGPYFLHSMALALKKDLSEIILIALDFYDAYDGQSLVKKIESLFHAPEKIFELMSLFQKMMQPVIENSIMHNCSLIDAEKNVSHQIKSYKESYRKALSYIVI